MVGQYKKLSQYGFTVVELVVVIVILGILMSLAIVNVSNSQVTGRDTEREEDVQAIARQMESLYNNSDFFGTIYASYPGTGQVNTQLKPYGEISTDILNGLNREALFSPSATVSDVVNDMSLRPATNTSEDPESIAPKPGSGNDIYVYQPLLRDGTLCATTGVGFSPQDECIRFNLYYWHEATNTVRKIMSRNQ